MLACGPFCPEFVIVYIVLPSSARWGVCSAGELKALLVSCVYILFGLRYIRAYFNRFHATTLSKFRREKIEQKPGQFHSTCVESIFSLYYVVANAHASWPYVPEKLEPYRTQVIYEEEEK